MTYHLLTGWLLRAVADFDVHAPGLAGHVLRSSDERRHVIASLLSVISADEYNADLGQLVQSARHDELIERAFGRVPSGHRRAMARVGKHTQPRRFYQYVGQVLSSPTRQEMADIVRQLARVTWPRLKILRALPADLRRPKLVDILSDTRQARDLSAVVSLLSATGGGRDEMCRALHKVESAEALSTFTRRWALKAAFPVHPVPPSADYRPICTGNALRSSARRFQNCARTHLVRILEGKSAFAEFGNASGSAVVHLIRLDDTWVLDDIYGPSNDPPHVRVEAAAAAYLKSVGIERAVHVREETEWAPLRRFIGQFDFQF